MPKRRLLWRLVPWFGLVVVAAALAFGWLARNTLETSLLESVRGELEATARFLDGQLPPDPPQDYEAFVRAARRLDESSGVRTTLLSAGGQVEADSRSRPDEIAAQLNRPELQAARAGNPADAVRYNPGLDERVLSSASRLGQALALDVAGAVLKPLSLSDLRSLLDSHRTQPGGRASGELQTGPPETRDVRSSKTVALETSALVVHYQPLRRLSDGLVAGAEALVRWRHPEAGLLGPAAFLERAERSGFVRALTAAVFLAIADVDPLGAALMAFAFAAATFFPALLLAIWWRGCTKWGAMAALVTGFVVMLGDVVFGSAFGIGKAGFTTSLGAFTNLSLSCETCTRPS